MGALNNLHDPKTLPSRYPPPPVFSHTTHSRRGLFFFSSFYHPTLRSLSPTSSFSSSFSFSSSHSLSFFVHAGAIHSFYFRRSSSANLYPQITERPTERKNLAPARDIPQDPERLRRDHLAGKNKPPRGAASRLMIVRGRRGGLARAGSQSRESHDRR